MAYNQNYTDLMKEFKEKIKCCDACKMYKLHDNKTNHFRYFYRGTPDQKLVCFACSEETLYPYIHYGEYYRSLRCANLCDLMTHFINDDVHGEKYFIKFLRQLCE